MRSIFEGNRFLGSVYAQMAIVVIVFIIMSISSSFFVGSIERKHMDDSVHNTFINTEAKITSYILEAETFLSGYSENIRSMILHDENINDIIDNVSDISNYIRKDEERMIGFIDIYGYLNVYGGKYISGRSWVPPSDYKPMDQTWYKAAIEAGGNIVVSIPCTDAMTGRTVISISRQIMDDDNNPLGVINLDMDINKLYNYAVYIKVTRGSYGFLIKQNQEILAHPESVRVNLTSLREADRKMAIIAEDLPYGNVTRERVVDYQNIKNFAFIQKIKYDWYLGIVIPVVDYNRNIINVTIFLSILSAVLAAILCTLMYQNSQAKMKSDLRTQQKSNFLATMSHEIRTPLNAILGMTEIQMQSSVLSPAINEAFLKINNSGNMLLNIINDILDLSKIEAGKLELSPVKYEVASLINDVVQLNYIRYESKPIEFKITVDVNTPSVLVGDELRIKQILNNLLSNAFKYTESGVVTLTTGAECVGRGGAVLVTLVFNVTDTGQGMSQEQVNKLFDDYSRFNLEANRTTEGSGLGMTITRNLIDLMQGKIIVKSVVNEGTTVTVRLPQKTDGIGIRGIIGKDLAESLQNYRLDNAVKRKRTQITHEYMPYGKILIVDDVETNLYVAKGLMIPYGLNIDLATNGFEAIEKIKQGNIYDIVFMDHMMPKLDGIETTKIIRNTGYTHPIVALTANALAGQAEMFLNNGFDGFISKPIDIRQLNTYLNKMIRDKQPAEVIEAALREKAEFDKKHGFGIQQNVDPQLAEIFARDAEKAAAVLEDLMKNNFNSESDIQLYVINVHGMKSALANVGETILSNTAFTLEQAGREKDINIIRSETSSFLNELRSVIEKIKPGDDENSENEDTDEAIAYLHEKLLIIKDACSSFDKKTIKNILSELRDKTWSRKKKNLLNLIAEHLLHSEFDDIAVLTEKNINPDQA